MSTTDDWHLLTPEQKRYQAKRMAVYAGMVEAMDFHIGRLIEHLKAIGEYENTIFIFTSDNGSEAAEPPNPESPLTRFALGRQGYSTDYETLGLKGSFNSIGPSFASAAASPLAYYKFYAGEGGMRVPLIIAGERLDAARGLSDSFAWVTDITPTILELTNAKAPGERYGGRVVEPMIGRSLVPLIEGRADRVYGSDEPIGYELGGNAALFQGSYKIVLNRGPVGDGEWHLYDIAKDPGETTDLAAALPHQLQQMLSNFREYVRQNGVLPTPRDFDAQRQVAINGLRARGGAPLLIGLLLILTLLPFYLFGRRRRS
jgi:arylsulfatase A-like enzyme